MYAVQMKSNSNVILLRKIEATEMYLPTLKKTSIQLLNINHSWGVITVYKL